jgi:hypothetical protein
MVHKTRKHYSGKSKKHKGVYSIPELRRSFEHIEEFVDEKIRTHVSKDSIVKDLRKEWSHVFLKDLDKKSAEAFVQNRMTKVKSSHRRTLRHKGGAGAQLANTATPIAGAPNDYTTRQGIYLAPGQIPDKAGHLPLSDGGKSTFGSFVQYVSKGFWNPEPGQSYDPVQGQTRFPVSTPVGMGDNRVHFAAKGGKRKTRRLRRRGGAAMPIVSSSPASVVADMTDMWYGKPVGPSPDQVQRVPNFAYTNVYPKPINL